MLRVENKSVVPSVIVLNIIILNDIMLTCKNEIDLLTKINRYQF